jgi:hypothetical protein
MLLVLFAGLWFLGAPAAHAVRDFVNRGRRLSRSTLTDGVIEESIEELVSQATVTLGRLVGRAEYSLARMLRSEYGTGPVKAKIAMAWVAVNDAEKLGRDLVATLNAGDRHGISFGSQAGGQRYSTAQDPYENDLAIAEAVLGGEEPDPTPAPGAVKFVHVDALGRIPEGAKRWTELEPVTLPDTGRLVVFVPKGRAA